MIILLILILLLSLLFVYLSCKKESKYMKNVPGPKPLFFFGNLLDFILKPTYKWLDVLGEYTKLYGDIVRVHDGPFSEFLLVVEPKFLEHILSSNKIIEKSHHYNYMHEWLGNGLINSSGKKWKTYRRILTPAFHFSILENFLEVFSNVGQVFIDKLKSETGKQSVDICELVGPYSLDVIAEAAMGIKLDTQTNNSSAFVQNTKIMGEIFVSRLLTIIPLEVYPFTPAAFREKRAVKVLHAHTDAIIQKKLTEKATSDELNQDANMDGKKKKLAFLDLLLTYTVDGNPLPKLHIREEVDTFMFAGHDTTSSAISFALYALANHPEIQEKAFLEQKQIFGDSKNTKITNSDLTKMKYLELVIKETLRLYPSVPLMGRQLSEDEEWNGILYPKGLAISISPYLIHRNPNHFPEPLKFIPERFENMKLSNPYIYIPFSAGPRNCIGQKFAMLEIKCTLSNVLRNFKLLPATPEHEPLLSPDAILTSRNGIRISLLTRNV